MNDSTIPDDDPSKGLNSRSFPLRHGAFCAPFHYVDESPTIGLRRDLELAQWLDQLGFDEVWFGEHHSGGFETISSPELMIAAAAEMTKRIRLGTGVVSLSYHNPLMVANRIMQLDHMTLGRLMFGVGPGLLPTDASMMGIDGKRQRDMMAESLDVLIKLFAGEEVTATTQWFTLNKAKVHLLPYSYPYPEIAVASSVTPSGAMLAGKHGFGMLCLAATAGEGFGALDANWAIANTIAAERGLKMDPSRLRLAGPMHIAESRDQARQNVKFGLEKWVNYFDRATANGLANMRVAGRDLVDAIVESGRAVIGTPADAIAQIERLQAKQGNFGVFLHLANDWADWEQTKKSYELYARFVMPHFARVNRHRQSSYNYWMEQSTQLKAVRQPGIDAAYAKWEDKKQQLAERKP
jgi:limonene 1,2-monooxygenase